jgi:hypothetical protein
MEELSQSKFEMQRLNELNKYIDQFNEYGSEFQDTWPDEFWHIYEDLRQVKTPRAKQLELLSTATSTNNMPTTISNEAEGSFSKYVVSLKISSPEPQNAACCRCMIF